MAQTYDLTKPIGLVLPSQPVEWNNRDLLLYALSIGSHNDDYPVVYEKDPKYAAFPTYPVCLSFKGTEKDVIDFAKKFGSSPALPGLPKFDPTKLVQGSQFIEVIKPLPPVSGTGWNLKRKIIGVHESTAGVTIDYEFIIADPQDVTYTRLITTGLNLKGVANGVTFDKTISEGITRSKPVADDKQPDWTLTEPTVPTMSTLYRLNGDYNPLHIDPNVGVTLGYGGLIMHGLLVYAIAARSLLHNLAGGDTSAFVAMSAGFSGPVTPGDSIIIKVWELGPGPNGTTELAFEAHAEKTGTVCLGNGVAHIRKSSGVAPSA